MVKTFKKFLENPRYDNFLLNNKELSKFLTKKKFINFFILFFFKNNNFLIKKYFFFDKYFLKNLKNLKKFKKYFLKPLIKA